jgi:DNA-binding IclR family transcriptional regulator
VNAQVLIDAIVRQTMVLIAQLSTADGVRSPLSHVADEVFVGLVRELERQNLGKKVIADMFGLALRSYQQKVQRLTESATARGVTLWGAMHAMLAERGSSSRTEILQHFKHDEEGTVRSILNDLVESGLVRRSGRGKDTRYRVATGEELEEIGASDAGDSSETNAALVWVHLYPASPMRKQDLAKMVPLPESAFDAAVERLVQDERVRIENRPDGAYCVTESCLISVGQGAGWEAAVVDHHRAVLKALAAKAVGGQHVSAAADEVGGTTLSFDLWPGHPREREVRALLATARRQVLSLWDEVAAYNKEHRPDETYSVTFYCGQNLTEEEKP